MADPFFAAIFCRHSIHRDRHHAHSDLDVSKTIKRVGYGSDSPPTKALVLPIEGAALGDSSGPIQTRIFVGPKAIKILKLVHATDPKVTLEPVLEFGFWGIFSKYLFLVVQVDSH